jgi:hypothetical protein
MSLSLSLFKFMCSDQTLDKKYVFLYFQFLHCKTSILCSRGEGGLWPRTPQWWWACGKKSGPLTNWWNKTSKYPVNKGAFSVGTSLQVSCVVFNFKGCYYLSLFQLVPPKLCTQTENKLHWKCGRLYASAVCSGWIWHYTGLSKLGWLELSCKPVNTNNPIHATEFLNLSVSASTGHCHHDFLHYAFPLFTMHQWGLFLGYSVHSVHHSPTFHEVQASKPEY